MLKSRIIEQFETSQLKKVSNLRLLRFIARLQSEWWLPYRAFAVVHLADIGGAQDVQRLADDGGIGGFGLFGVDVAVNHGGSLLIWLRFCFDFDFAIDCISCNS